MKPFSNFPTTVEILEDMQRYLVVLEGLRHLNCRPAEGNCVNYAHLFHSTLNSYLHHRDTMLAGPAFWRRAERRRRA